MMADAQNRREWSCPLVRRWQSDWQSFIVPDDHPDLHYWQPGSSLPELHFTNHLGQPHVRAAQRVAHTCLLPVLDRLRLRHSDQAYPQRIPAAEANRISSELREHVTVWNLSTLPA
jgi:hypothetical protein